MSDVPREESHPMQTAGESPAHRPTPLPPPAGAYEKSHAPAVAPWVRTRLRAAPGASGGLALLVFITALLAAALPRVVDAYETEGLRHAIRSAPVQLSQVEVTTPLEQGDTIPPESLWKDQEELRGLLAAPLRTDRAQTVHGIRTMVRVAGLDPWLPRPSRVPVEFTLASPSDLGSHATLKQGRMPSGSGTRPEAAVTVATAEALGIKAGSVVHVPGITPEPVAFTVTGIVQPHDPERPYWAVEPRLASPVLTTKPDPTQLIYYWQAGLLVSPEASSALSSTKSTLEAYWRFPTDPGRLTARDEGPLAASLDSLTGGPALVKVLDITGPAGQVATNLDGIVAAHHADGAAISPVVAVAVFGIGTVAAVVIAMTGGLFLSRRDGELTLLRARGASLPGIGLRLLGETAAVTVPAALLGLLAAVALVRGPDTPGAPALTGSAPLLPSVLGAALVALVAALVLPARAVLRHRRPRLHGAREDMVDAKPSRRRLVAELTALVLAAGAIASLRLRGTSDSGDHLVSAAPVLVGVIAAFVLVRLQPLPLRWLARPARRMRGAVGPLALARAGRASSTGVLPLLALVLALTTAAFGGSVLAGVAEARDRAALLSTGSDVRIEGTTENVPVTPEVMEAVRGTKGVREAQPVQVEYGLELPSPVATDQPMSSALVAVDPAAYARLAARADNGAFPAGLLASTGKGGPEAVGDTDRVLPAIASPDVAARLGDRPMLLIAAAGSFHVKVVAVRDSTPAIRGENFLVVNAADVTNRRTTVVLATGTPDGPALRAAVAGKSKDLAVTLRSETRGSYVDSPLQSGAEGLYAAAIGAGAAYAVVAVLLSLTRSGPERATLLARLRTMGLTRGQGRRLLGLEALPPAVFAALGGALAGWATVPLLAPGVDLHRLALAMAEGGAALGGTRLRADPWSLVLPAVAVVLLTGAAAGVQAWWTGRRSSVKELRAGDAR
ncbi:FtsX-like permease family protein [Streptomyces roseolus]|uniref:FtsX-like permease family protein n=1 Tax=Streptomyces roseolus TaxID=67358 RepID=UPI00199D669D|nr:FtsX-like permease family protein [Streptomyces roseolus]GGR21113.1 membrane protein [Streptomyces roseolus]